jgi:hypothetical protein
VQRILDAHQLASHLVQIFKLSKDSRKSVFVLLDAGILNALVASAGSRAGLFFTS